MNLTLDNNRLRSLIPNVIHEVEGETSLFDKLQPWISFACFWVERYFLGDLQPEGHIYELAEKIIVNKAFAEAIPSIDVTLSPAGFAVINTDGRAPASKERIERLIASLNSFVDESATALLEELHRNHEWSLSENRRWFCATFIPTFCDVPKFRREQDLIGTYLNMRDIALAFEQTLADRYLGHGFLSSLRSSYHVFKDNGTAEIFEMIHAAELRYITYHIRDSKAKCPDEHEVWHMVQPIIAKLSCWPELKDTWEAEMGDKFKAQPFKNTVKGGFYF